MKKTILLLLLIATAVAGYTKDEVLHISQNKVELIINADTKESQLAKIKKTLKEEANIDFNYKDVITTSKKKLSKITIEVNSNDGVKASKTILISNIYIVGFIRNYQATGEDALIIGNLREQEIKLD